MKGYKFMYIIIGMIDMFDSIIMKDVLGFRFDTETGFLIVNCSTTETKYFRLDKIDTITIRKGR